MKKSILLRLFVLVLFSMTIAAPAFATTYRQSEDDNDYSCYEDDSCNDNDNDNDNDSDSDYEWRTYESEKHYYQEDRRACASGYDWNSNSGACVKQYHSDCPGSYSLTSGECYQDRNHGAIYNTYNLRSTTYADVNYYGSCQYIQNYISEGATIRANGGVDVYIVKYDNGKKYKRLVLNPGVFENYPHLSWEQVKNVDRSILDCFTTSDLVRSQRDGAVFKLYPSGDNGIKRQVTSTASSRYYIDTDSIYTINGFDEDSYEYGTPLR
jgi:hypothetical protein